MENFREQIAMLNLDSEREIPENFIKPVKFSMDPSEVQAPREKRKYVRHKENSMTGKHPMSEENKRRQSEKMKELWQNPTFKEKMVESMKGAPHKKFGKVRPDAWQSQPRTPEYRQYISSYMRKYYEEHPEAKAKQAERMKTIKKHNWTEEERKQMSERQKGDFWINNGERETKMHKDCPIPEGYIKGRLPRSEESKKKTSETMTYLWKEFKENNNATA